MVQLIAFTFALLAALQTTAAAPTTSAALTRRGVSGTRPQCDLETEPYTGRGNWYFVLHNTVPTLRETGANSIIEVGPHEAKTIACGNRFKITTVNNSDSPKKQFIWQIADIIENISKMCDFHDGINGQSEFEGLTTIVHSDGYEGCDNVVIGWT